MFWAIVRPFVPHIMAFIVGFGIALKIQDYKITGLKQEHTEYIQEQTRLVQEEIRHANEQREKSAKDYESAKKDLASQVAAGDVYRRCVAAGKCGVLAISGSQNGSVPPAGRADGTSSDTVPTAGVGSSQIDDKNNTLASDCATTTLMLNHLQRNIEQQTGY